nr:zinc finger MYM-type protein 3-like [Drosophila takahashii]
MLQIAPKMATGDYDNHHQTSTVDLENSHSPVKRQRGSELDHSALQQQSQQAQQPQEKPDAQMYTFGVNAWKQWVMTRNANKRRGGPLKYRRLFETELLQMTAYVLNERLCLFVKEVRKPNGTEYAPDTIYYLVLGIQQYLYVNGRIDNIFYDPYYGRFTECLDELACKFSVPYNDSQYIVTRVEEEHLWECKQLGAHSPHVLLSTLMFFNTKHFNLTTVEEHMQLSFSSQNSKVPGSRKVLLRFYPPQAGLDASPRKKKVYEQQENEENPLRCPVRLYEFYLSKCPESVKTRNDVFYLKPERSCVPDSPVWYSTQALEQDALQWMLHRVKMVKEINIALLTT